MIIDKLKIASSDYCANKKTCACACVVEEM